MSEKKFDVIKKNDNVRNTLWSVVIDVQLRIFEVEYEKSNYFMFIISITFDHRVHCTTLYIILSK